MFSRQAEAILMLTQCILRSMTLRRMFSQAMIWLGVNFRLLPDQRAIQAKVSLIKVIGTAKAHITKTIMSSPQVRKTLMSTQCGLLKPTTLQEQSLALIHGHGLSLPHPKARKAMQERDLTTVAIGVRDVNINRATTFLRQAETIRK